MAYLANMSTNELYLDSADIRNNIVSLAKMLGYTPNSHKSATKLQSMLLLMMVQVHQSLWQKEQLFVSNVVDAHDYQYIN